MEQMIQKENSYEVGICTIPEEEDDDNGWN